MSAAQLRRSFMDTLSCRGNCNGRALRCQKTRGCEADSFGAAGAGDECHSPFQTGQHDRMRVAVLRMPVNLRHVWLRMPVNVSPVALGRLTASPIKSLVC